LTHADSEGALLSLAFGDGIDYVRHISPAEAAKFRKTKKPVSPTKYERIVLKGVITKHADSLVRLVLRSTSVSVRAQAVFAAADAATASLFEGTTVQSQSDRKRSPFEALQSINLPFVSELNVDEIVTLREEAKQALPSFRSLLDRSVLGAKTDDKIDEGTAQLRAQAAEVRAELDALRRGQRWRAGLVTASAGLALSIVAAAPPSFGAVALGGALAAVSLMHPHVAKDLSEAARLQASPAYLVVKAEDLLRHADG
jgi:hypothetical protein